MSKTIPERMKEIEEMYPLSLEHGEDARYIWPKRWKAMKEIFKNMEPIYKQKPKGNTDYDLW